MYGYSNLLVIYSSDRDRNSFADFWQNPEIKTVIASTIVPLKALWVFWTSIPHYSIPLSGCPAMRAQFSVVIHPANWSWYWSSAHWVTALPLDHCPTSDTKYSGRPCFNSLVFYDFWPFWIRAYLWYEPTAIRKWCPLIRPTKAMYKSSINNIG